MILAGAIGGGTVSLALFEPRQEDDVRLVRSASVPGAEYPGLRPIVRRFVGEDLPGLVAACFAVEGQVDGRRARPAGCPWPVDGAELDAATGLAGVEVVALGELGGEGMADALVAAARRMALRRR